MPFSNHVLIQYLNLGYYWIVGLRSSGLIVILTLLPYANRCDLLNKHLIKKGFTYDSLSLLSAILLKYY